MGKLERRTCRTNRAPRGGNGTTSEYQEVVLPNKRKRPSRRPVIRWSPEARESLKGEEGK